MFLMEKDTRITDQTVFDCYKMSEQEFIDYYKMFWFESQKEVESIRNLVVERIKNGTYEIVCYLEANDCLLRKSCLNRLKTAFEMAEKNKPYDLGRCETMEGINKSKPKKSLPIISDTEIDIDEIKRKFEKKIDWVRQLYNLGIQKGSEIAKLLGISQTYTHRLLIEIK